MNLLFIGMTFSLIGKVLLAIGVILAHTQLAHEHRVDARVIHSFHTEKVMTIVGLLLIIFGYFLEVTFFGGFSNFAFCTETNCTATLFNSVISQ